MTIFCKLSRKHYWCTPHRSEDRRLVQVCYECGAERPARELHTEELSAGLTARPIKSERLLRPRNDPHVAIGQTVLRHLTLVK